MMMVALVLARTMSGNHDLQAVIGSVGVGPHYVGHNRGVDDPQPLQAVNVAVLVNHRQRPNRSESGPILQVTEVCPAMPAFC